MPDPDGHHVGIGLGCRQIRVHSLLAHLSLRHELRQVEIGVWADHEIRPVGEKRLSRALRHAPDDADYNLADAAESLQIGKTAQDALLGIIADGARVHEDAIGLIYVFSQVIANRLHDRRDDFTVGHVHLAPVCLNEKATAIIFHHNEMSRTKAHSYQR